MPPLFKRPIPGQPVTVNLNSVRHPVPYAGSTNPDDLMNLYVGNTQYRKINRYMRADDHQAGTNEILDEIVAREGRRPLSADQAGTQVFAERNAAEDYINTVAPANKQYWETVDPDDFEASYDSPFSDFTNSQAGKTLIRQAGGDYSPEALERAAQQVLETPIQLRRKQLQTWKPFRQEAEQVVASIPHINQALKARPGIGAMSTGENYTDVAKHFINDPLGDTIWDATPDNPLMIKGKAVEPDDFATVAGDFEQLLEGHLQNQGKSVWNQDGSIHPSAIEAANDFVSGKLKLGDPTSNTLYRGLHFKNPKEYDDFVTQNQPGKIVEYPAFTSTTSNERTRDFFSGNRSGEQPVLMEIQSPTQGRWVENIAEQEYLYPANSRFEIIGSEPIQGKVPGTKLIARETVAQTPVESRSSGIMGRLKSRAMVPEPAPVVAAEDLLNEHLARQSRLGQTRSAYRDRMSPTSNAVPMKMGYDYSDRIQMV